MNMKSRHEAVRLLKEGTTIVIFPAGGVATAKKGFDPRRRPAVEDVPGQAHPGDPRQRRRSISRARTASSSISPAGFR